MSCTSAYTVGLARRPTSASKVAEGDYSIEEIPPPASSIQETIGRFVSPLLSPLGIVTWLLQARILSILWFMLQQSRTSNTSTAAAALFIAAQLLALVIGTIEDGWRLLCRSPRHRPMLRIVGDSVPEVDIVIVTCGEEIDVILDTVRAACAQNYSPAKWRVLVSDDGSDEMLKEAVTDLAKHTDVCEILYYARTGKGNTKKGGNLNAALRLLDSTGGRPEFCTFCDADMMLEPDFLRTCMAHLITNPEAAIAVVPQRFYNIPPNDPIYQSMDTQNNLDSVQRDSIGASWNTGPGALWRRKAIDDIGGFHEGDVMEDLLSGLLVLGKGWQIVYVREELQWGLAPSTLRGHVAQRIKWAVGSAHNSRLIGFGFDSNSLPRSTWKQRVVAFSYAAAPYLCTTGRLLRMWLLLALVLSGRALVLPSNSAELRYLIYHSWTMGLLQRTVDILTGLNCGYLALKRRKQGLTWLSPFVFISVWMDLLPKRFGDFRLKFKPTAALESNTQERDARTRPGLYRRVQILVLKQGLWYHVLIFSIAAFALSADIGRAQQSNSFWHHLLTHSLAPGIEWDLFPAMLAPVFYAVWPPIMPERRKLMEYRGGCWRPKPESKGTKWNCWGWMVEIPQIASFALGCWVCWSAVY